MDDKQQLYDLVAQFIDSNQIRCAESVWQMDHVIKNAYEFIEQCCEIVGYYQDPDKESQ